MNKLTIGTAIAIGVGIGAAFGVALDAGRGGAVSAALTPRDNKHDNP